MVTDTERREVARTIRHAWVNVPDRDPVRHHLRVLCEIYEAVGISDGEADAIGLFDRLADLIEPTCDRDALLELADELDRVGYNDWLHSGEWEPEEIARRIREALGVEP